MNQAALVTKIRATLNEALEPQIDKNRAQIDSFVGKIDFSDLLVMNAQSKSYGHLPKEFDLYSDTSSEPLWTWELASPGLYLEQSLLKHVTSIRQSLS